MPESIYEESHPPGKVVAVLLGSMMTTRYEVSARPSNHKSSTPSPLTIAVEFIEARDYATVERDSRRRPIKITPTRLFSIDGMPRFMFFDRASRILSYPSAGEITRELLAFILARPGRRPNADRHYLAECRQLIRHMLFTSSSEHRQLMQGGGK